MRLKLVLIVLGSLLLCTYAKASEKREIILHATEYEDWWAKDERSHSIIPTATVDGNTLCIHADKALENVRITVVDAHGNVWFDAEESSLSGSYTFTLDGNPKGTLTLVIETETVWYVGEFTL